MCVGVSVCGRGISDYLHMCLVLNVIFHIYSTYVPVLFIYLHELRIGHA